VQNRGGDINLAVLNDVDEDNIKKLSNVFCNVPAEALRTIYLLSKLSFTSYFQWCSSDQERRSPKIIYSNKELSLCNIKITSESDAHGLLKATHILCGQVFTTSSGFVYNFNHLSIQEYLCALYISLLPEDDQVQLFEDHFSDFPHMWPFYAGISKCKSPKIFESLFRKVWSANHKDKVSALHCIYEAQISAELCGHIPQASLKIQEFSMLPYDCLTASYFMSIVPIMHLSLKSCSIGDQTASMLFRYKGLVPLKAIDFGTNYISNEGMELISSLLTENKITHVSFSANFLNDGGIFLVPSTLSYLTYLVELDLSQCFMDSNSPIVLGKFLAFNTSLLSLNVSFTGMKSDGIVAISQALQHNHTLVQLIAMCCDISYKGALSIRDMLKANNGLKFLKLNNNHLEVDSIVVITEALPYNSKLIRLDLHGCQGPSSEKFIRLPFMPKKRSLGHSVLRVMHIGSNCFSDEEMECILTPSLSHLILTGIDGINRSTFKYILCLTHLCELAIGSCYLDTNNIIALGIFLKEDTVLQSLSIYHNRITDEGITVITDALQTNNSLLHLTLLNCVLKSRNSKCISEMLKVNKGLYSLVVSLNSIGDSGIIAIAESLSINNTLTKLTAEFCEIEGAGLSALAKLVCTTNSLKELNVIGSKFSERKLLIQAADANPSIESIMVDDDQLDPAFRIMLNSVNSRKPKVHTYVIIIQWSMYCDFVLLCV